MTDQEIKNVKLTKKQPSLINEWHSGIIIIQLILPEKKTCFDAENTTVVLPGFGMESSIPFV